MKSKILWLLPTLCLAFAILSLSILRSSEIQYRFAPFKIVNNNSYKTSINYQFPTLGRVTPESPLWAFKAITDKVKLNFKTEEQDRAYFLLSLADERLCFARHLFEEGKAETGLSVLTKAEKYLELASISEGRARVEGTDTHALLQKLSTASVAHKEMIDYLTTISPEEARPLMVKTSDYPKRLFSELKSRQRALGIIPWEHNFE